MTNADRLGLAASLAVHVLAALILFWHPPIDERRKPVQADIGSLDRLYPKLKGFGEGGSACKGSTYNGLGYRSDRFGTVTEIGDRSPAERAGLRIGDMLLNDEDFWPDKYQPGTDVVLIVRRSTEVRLAAVVGVICQE